MFHKKSLCSLLQAYFDGQIKQEDIERFQAHQEHCPHCQEALQGFNKISDFIKTTQGGMPDKAFFDTVWKGVEERLIRERLSIFHLMRGWADMIYYYGKLLMKPTLAVCFILLLIMIPHFEKRKTHVVHVVPRIESEIKRIESKMNVMLVTTKEKKWKVIWVMPIKKGGGSHNAQKTDLFDEDNFSIVMFYLHNHITDMV